MLLSMQPILVASTIFLCCSEIFWVYKMKRRDGVTNDDIDADAMYRVPTGWGGDPQKRSPCKGCLQGLGVVVAEREALELILSQNIIKLQTTDNQV